MTPQRLRPLDLRESANLIRVGEAGGQMKRWLLRILSFETPNEYFERCPDANQFTNASGYTFKNPKHIDALVTEAIAKRKPEEGGS